jgi:hypothetical protein
MPDHSKIPLLQCCFKCCNWPGWPPTRAPTPEPPSPATPLPDPPRQRPIGVWQGLAMDSLKFHVGPPWPTFLRPADELPLKRPHGCYRGGPRAGRAACGRLLPLWTPQPPGRTPMSETRMWVRSSPDVETSKSRVRFFFGQWKVKDGRDVTAAAQH